MSPISNTKNMKHLTEKQRMTLSVFVGVLFLVAVGFYLWGGFMPKLANQSGEYYTNEKGQKWTLPEGEYSFTVSAAGYPKFTGGVVNPVKVVPGDTQTFTVRVASPVPIKSVIAITHTDTKTQELALTLKESKALSGDYLKSQPYLIGDDNKLIINNGSYAQSMVDKLVARVEAQALVEYTYEGSWVVNDTHTKTYTTKFISENENAEKAEFSLLWSDPVCVFNAGGRLQGEGCVVESGVEGFDGGDVTIASGQTVTLNGDATFIWNGDMEGNRSLTIEPGASIILQSGSGSTASIREKLLYFNDVDGDGYAQSAEMHYECQDQCFPEIRVKDSPSRPWSGLELPNGGIDCKDLNEADSASVYPGQTAYFNTAIQGTPPETGGKEWDYDCDGSATGGWAEYRGNTWVEGVYSALSGGVPEGGIGGLNAYQCITGADFTMNSCGQFPYTTGLCDTNDIGGEVGSPSEVPDGVTNGWMHDACSACISTDVAGYCK